MYVLLVLACSSSDTPDAPDALAIPALLPLPEVVQATDGRFTLDASSTVTWSGGGEAEAELLAAALRPATGFELPVTEGEDGDVVLVVDATLDLPAEGYRVDVDDTCVRIEAADAAGVYYGTQTARQLFPSTVFYDTPLSGPWEIPGVHIDDAPRFAWRGFMLDVARHFFDVAAVQRQIDLMALHKLNRLHLHLTDDQGWRIEITSWPLLTEIGGSTEVGGGEGGFYTQDDYAELVAYAAARHVVVVPEIDFPGHSHAALASYGELNEDGVPLDLYTGAGVISTPLWLDGEATWDFVEDVWGEVTAITPGPWVHVGADEAIDTDPDDYAVFVPWLQEVVGDAGKTMVGWDEIGDVELAPPFLNQLWFADSRTVASVEQGGAMIASPAEHTYLDMVHDTDAVFGQTWAGPVGVEDAYDWDPVISGVEEADVAGVEAALWTELINSNTKLDFMVWPRLVAIAEVGWTAEEGRDWEDFRGRLGAHGERLSALGVGYYASPEVEWE